jgi:cytidine deaminase
MNETQIKELIKKALDMRKFSYTPYSHFNVGAALLSADDRIFTGCNIENASYTPTNCAERTAFFKAVSEGVHSFKRIVITGGPEEGELQYATPCGICRQVMREFCHPDSFEVILAKSTEDYKIYTLAQLLPESFGPENLL